MHIILEQNQLGLLIGLAHRGENLVPDAVVGPHDAGHEFLAGVSSGIGCSRASPGSNGGIAAAANIRAAIRHADLRVGATTRNIQPTAIDHLQKIDAKHQLDYEIGDDQHDDGRNAEAAATAAHRNVDTPSTAAAGQAKTATGATALPAPVLDAVIVWLFIVETHGWLSPALGFKSTDPAPGI